MSAIETFRSLSGHHRIGGALVRAAGTTVTPVIDPATEERIGEVVDATSAEVASAIAVANTAQRAWNKVNAHRRAELLHEVARRMIAGRPLTAEMLTREMGKPPREAKGEI